MNIGLDIDGTVDSFPVLFQHLIAGWTAAADHVYIITGIHAEEVTDEDHASKVQYLTAMGIPPSQYYTLVVVPTKPGMDHAQAKAQYIQDNHIDVLIDNNVDNCKAAKPFCAVFCLWNVKEKGDKGITLPENKRSEEHHHTHAHEHRTNAEGVEMCCDGRTAAQHRATSSDGKCCVDVHDENVDMGVSTGPAI